MPQRRVVVDGTVTPASLQAVSLSAEEGRGSVSESDSEQAGVVASRHEPRSNAWNNRMLLNSSLPIHCKRPRRLLSPSPPTLACQERARITPTASMDPLAAVTVPVSNVRVRAISQDQPGQC